MSRPFPNYRFFVTLDPADAYLAAASAVLPDFVGVGAFSDVTGLSGELEVMAVPEGGQNDYVHQLPVRHTWGRITLKKGILLSAGLWDWFAVSVGGSHGARRDGAVILLSPDGIPVVAWEWRAGLAAKWVGPDLNAREGAVAVESLEIVHEGLTQVSVGSVVAGAANAAVGAVKGFL